MYYATYGHLNRNGPVHMIQNYPRDGKRKRGSQVMKHWKRLVKARDHCRELEEAYISRQPDQMKILDRHIKVRKLKI